MTTSWCNVRCEHCLANAGPDRKQRVTFDEIYSYIEHVREQYPLSLVVFSGGECSVLGEELLNAIAYCDSLGIVTRVVTNCSWAKSEEEAKRKLIEFRESGLQEINYSVDDFHQAHIPIQYVENAWKASKNIGFLSVVLVNTVGANSVITPDFLCSRMNENIPCVLFDGTSGRSFPPFSSDGTLYIISLGRLSRLGRGRRLLSDEFFELKEIDHFSGGCCDILSNPTITPDYHLAACCGGEACGNSVIDLGDLSKEDPLDILNRGDQDPIINMLALFGPASLLKFAQVVQPSLCFSDRYSGACDMCEDICRREDVVKAIRNNFDLLIDKVISAREKVECFEICH
jgi:hypothetical protein